MYSKLIGFYLFLVLIFPLIKNVFSFYEGLDSLFFIVNIVFGLLLSIMGFKEGKKMMGLLFGIVAVSYIIYLSIF